MTTLPPLVNEARLATYLAEQLPAAAQTVNLTALKVGTGHSNETFLITRELAGGETQEWILRRPPRGPLLPTAHDVGREYRVLSALANTPVPVPHAVLLCTDIDVI